MREAVRAITSEPVAGPTPPLDAIREAVRSEMSQIAVLVAEAATKEAALVAAKAYQASREGALLSVLHALAALLAIRWLLMIAGLGAFALAYWSLQVGTPLALATLISYAVLIVIPLVWLESRKKVERPA